MSLRHEIARLADQLQIVHQIAEAEARRATLLLAEQFARAAQFQVRLRDLESVVRLLQHAQTPGEAVSWGKVDPTKLPDAVVCYTDTTIAMPLLTHYALAKRKPRKLKRLYDQLPKMMKALTKEYFAHNKVKMLDGSEPKF